MSDPISNFSLALKDFTHPFLYDVIEEDDVIIKMKENGTGYETRVWLEATPNSGMDIASCTRPTQALMYLMHVFSTDVACSVGQTLWSVK